MKNIAVFFDVPGAMEHPFSTPDYWTSYCELSEAIARHGGQLYITRNQKTYLGNGSFSHSWIIHNNSLKEAGAVTVDVIYDKGRFNSDGTIPIFNCEKIKKICNNKWLMYEYFSEYCPKTFFVKDATELQSALSKLSTKKIVFKPFSGGEGVGVKIEEKIYFSQPNNQLLFPGIICEFLDTSGGIPGIIHEMHDLRLAIFDGEVFYSYYRTPPQGSFLANVSKGGKFAMVDPTKLPKDVIAISKKIDAHLTDCPHRFYSIDFGYTKDGPKIIEMNSELGLLPNKDGEVFVRLKEKLADVFMNM